MWNSLQIRRASAVKSEIMVLMDEEKIQKDQTYVIISVLHVGESCVDQSDRTSDGWVPTVGPQ